VTILLDKEVIPVKARTALQVTKTKDKIVDNITILLSKIKNKKSSLTF
jgi:hypothetical protein